MYTNKEDIAKWLRKYDIDDYTINEDLTVDVEGNVYLDRAFMGQSKEEWLEELESYNEHTDPEAQIDFELCDDGSYEGNGSHHVYEEKTDQVYELPIQFGRVSGNFWINHNELRTLKGCPHTVGLSFSCENNELHSLASAPATIGHHFWCEANPLEEIGDIKTHIGGQFIGPDYVAELLNVKSLAAEKTILDEDTFNQAVNALKEKRQLEQAMPKAATPSAAIIAITKARAEQGLPPVPPPKYRFEHLKPKAQEQVEVPQQAPKRTFKL